MVLSAATIVLLVDNARLRSQLAEKNDPASSDSQNPSGGDNSSAETPSDTSSQKTPAVPEADLWKLRVANSENVLPADFSVKTALITPAYARDQGMSFDARAVADLNAMLAAANKEGARLLVISCFRTLTKQTNLYNAEVNKWLGRGYSEAEAKAKAGTIVAVPGTSDHNLGLAVDLNSVEESFENTKEFDWLQEHAAEYGFVMRYPKHKQDITKIIYEPWHYRYVGKEHAAKMNELDMCLEEYVEYLGIEF
ncbi:MAG: D-alanyl-D-alanine carboxypeptidase family protein [Ruminococcaceae bacterium]|nr:D-alanyl-D-alanine carboxypeptidase family protein [Oscillospiraceae bacterium]